MNLKFSNYNNFAKYNGKYICFNSLSGGLFEIPAKLYKIYVENKNNLNDLKNKSNSFFELLIKTRFIIADDLDELNIIRYRNKKEIFDNTYYLTINPTMDCNFKCWYCYEAHKKSILSDDIQERIIRNVSNLFKSGTINGLSLNWFGGEPLLFFDKIVYPLSVKLKKICEKYNFDFTNSITTNGYLINKEMIDKIKKIKLFNYQITLDGNKKQHDKSRILKNGKPTYDKIVKNINLLCNNISEIKINLRINYNNETISEIQEIGNSFAKKNRKKININFQRIWQSFKMKLY